MVLLNQMKHTRTNLRTKRGIEMIRLHATVKTENFAI